MRLTYFDFPGGRGEDCRIALHIAGVDFEDDRIKGPQWRERKADSPYGGLPLLQVEGKPVLSQSNAILAWIGRTYGLHPTDGWEAARHEAVMAAVEQLREQLAPSLRISDPEEKKAVREQLSATTIPEWGQRFERQIDGPFLSGDALHVADLKLFVVHKWFATGVLDHVPTDVFKDAPKLMAHYEAVSQHPGVVSWYAR